MALTFSKKRQRRLPILRLIALALVALVLLLGSNAFALSPIKKVPVGNGYFIAVHNISAAYDIWTICVDGYKFIVTNKDYDEGVSISVTQMYEERDGKALPAKCK
jgi:hypothetical protein